MSTLVGEEWHSHVVGAGGSGCGGVTGGKGHRGGGGSTGNGGDDGGGTCGGKVGLGGRAGGIGGDGGYGGGGSAGGLGGKFPLHATNSGRSFERNAGEMRLTLRLWLGGSAPRRIMRTVSPAGDGRGWKSS